MKLLTFIRQCGKKMRILTEIQFPYECISIGYPYWFELAALPLLSKTEEWKDKLKKFLYFVQWSTQNHEVFFRNAGLLKKNGWWFDFLIKAKIGNFKAWHWWGKMKSFWTVSISELKCISLGSTDFNVLPLLDSYLLLWASRASRPITGVNYFCSLTVLVSYIIFHLV